MSSEPERAEVFDSDVHTSRFTYRDLRLLSQSSTICPLRVIALIDFDCFYAQCEGVRLGIPPDQPLGVQQFLHVIAINYPARAAGLKKVVTAVEAKQKCPNIVLQHVPTWREGDDTWRYRDDVRDHMSTDKSSLDYYRLQSRTAIELVKQNLPSELQKVEKASIDEIFLDLSAQVHNVLLDRYPELRPNQDIALDAPLPSPPSEVLEWHDARLIEDIDADARPEALDWHDVALNIGSEVVASLRARIFDELHYTCSAGIARNKSVAKLAAGHNKPNKQTVVRDCAISSFFSTYKFTKIRGMGGKLGKHISQAFSAELISDLLQITLKQMQGKVGTESGLWVYRVIRGFDHSEVTPRTQIQSMLSAKTFTPSIDGLDQAERWLRIFSADIVGRMEDQEGRRPKTLAVHHQISGRFGPTRSKQTRIPLGLKLDIECLTKLFRDVLIDITRDEPSWPCLILSVGVSDFYDIGAANSSIASFMTQPRQSPTDLSDLSGAETSLETREGLVSLKRPKKRTLHDFRGFADQDIPNSVKTARGSDGERKTYVHSSVDVGRTDQPLATLNAVEEGCYLCPTCSKAIPAEDVLEHLDWHAAMDLQDQGSQG